MLDIVFLGTGAAVPSPIRNLSAVWMHHSLEEGESFLFDCGEGTQRQLMIAKINFMRINHIFISHWHADHWAGLIGLIQTMNLENRTSPLHVYGPEADRFVEAILALGYWAPRFSVHAHDVPFEGDHPTEIYKSANLAVLSFPASHSVPAVMYCLKEHDRVNVDIQKAAAFGLKQGRVVGELKDTGSVMWKGKKITLAEVGVTKPGLKVVYTGDTRSFAGVEHFARNADLLIHDSTFDEETEDIMHAGATQAAEAAKKAGAKQLILTHFSRRYMDTKELVEKAQRIFPNTTAAKDFLRIEMKKDVFKVNR